MTFSNFCLTYNQKLATNPDAAKAFAFLASAESVANMMVFTQIGLPAISGLAHTLEITFDSNTQFNLENPHYRQMVGKMVKFIFFNFGFETEINGLEERAQLRNFSECKYFKTAAVYHETNLNPQKKLHITIV